MRDLIVELDLRLENVEPRNGAGFKTILLILQLAFQKLNRFLLHHDQFAVHDHLVKLRFYIRNRLIDRISKREVGRIALEEGTANCAERTVIKNQLRSRHLDVVGDITAQIVDGAFATTTTTAAESCQIGSFAQIWIRPIPSKARTNVRQRLGANLDDHAFGALDLLDCGQNSRVLLERGNHRLINLENGRPSFRPPERTRA